MLTTSYYSNIKNLDENAYTIQVSIYKPSNIEVDGKAPMFYPTRELLLQYKQKTIDANEYTKRYKIILNKNIGTVEYMLKLVDRLYELSKKYNVYLLCYEPHGFCHRRILLECIKKFVAKHTDYGTDWIVVEKD